MKSFTTLIVFALMRTLPALPPVPSVFFVDESVNDDGEYGGQYERGALDDGVRTFISFGQVTYGRK